MSLVSIKQDIITFIQEIGTFDLSILSPNTPLAEKWGIMDENEVQSYISEITRLLKRIVENESVLNDLSENELTNLRGFLESLVSHYNAFKTLELKDITSNHHNVLNEFKKVNDHLKAVSIYTILKISPEINDITTKLEHAEQLLGDFDEEKYKKAISLIKELNKEKVGLERKILEEQLGTFLKRAEEHKYIYIFNKRIPVNLFWLTGAITSGVIILFMVHGFLDVLKINGDISVGAAILRISSLAVPTYFLYFCINQFNEHNRLYEAYSYRNTALKLMTDLMETNPDKSEFILERGLKILFSEPLSKTDGKYDKQIVNDLISILTSQVVRKE